MSLLCGIANTLNRLYCICNPTSNENQFFVVEMHEEFGNHPINGLHDYNCNKHQHHNSHPTARTVAWIAYDQHKIVWSTAQQTASKLSMNRRFLILTMRGYYGFISNSTNYNRTFNIIWRKAKNKTVRFVAVGRSCSEWKYTRRNFYRPEMSGNLSTIILNGKENYGCPTETRINRSIDGFPLPALLHRRNQRMEAFKIVSTSIYTLSALCLTFMFLTRIIYQNLKGFYYFFFVFLFFL